ncbi:MAG: B12-binding domain-containing radical SAM protein [Planctomycetota bacterium]
MRIQLIHPPVYLNVHAMTALRPALPLGLAYVAGSLHEQGHELSLIDAVAEAPDTVTLEDLDARLFRLGLSPEEISARVDPGADAIGITNLWSFSWPLVRSIIQVLRRDHPELPIVCGGEHFTGLPEFSMEQAPLDVVVLGEGEEAACEVFAALERGERELPGIASVVYREGGKPDGRPVRSAAVRARRKTVDEIPRPYWELFDVELYNRHNLVTGLNQGKTMPILATRGCPYQCTYCSNVGMWTTRWYARTPADVVDEIESYMRRYGATDFPFQDLTAILKRDWVIQFCEEILRRNLKITWQFPSGTRCEVIDARVAKLLRLSGGRALAFAPESGSERTRKLIKKQMTERGLMDAVHASVKEKLNITAFIVIGFPHDDKQDLKETVRLARKLGLAGIDDVAIGFFFPIPNTELYARLMEEGRIDLSDRFLLTPIYANDEKLEAHNNYCDHLSSRELTAWKYRILLNFYGMSFATHPWRIFSLAWNVLRGKETRKMETFLIELKRKGLVWLRSRLGRLPRGEAGSQVRASEA